MSVVVTLSADSPAHRIGSAPDKAPARPTTGDRAAHTVGRRDYLPVGIGDALRLPEGDQDDPWMIRRIRSQRSATAASAPWLVGR